MKIKSEQLPVCFSCRLDSRIFPCRDKEGNLAPDRLVQGVVLCCQHRVGTPQYESNAWANECLDELVSEAPETAFQIIVSVLSHLKEVIEIGTLAAGPFENLVVGHGGRMIGQIEIEAANSERFRYALSGIWGPSGIESDVWERIQIAVGQGPWIDKDHRTPQGSKK